MDKKPIIRILKIASINIIPAFLFCFLFCFLLPYAQEEINQPGDVEGRLPRPLYREYRDYFDKDRDPKVRVLLHALESHHLSKKFWADYTTGRNEYGRNKYGLDDMRFILRYTPNHPKALTLVGSIARLRKDPSLPIPYYEQAIRLFPQHAVTHAQYGVYLVDIGDINSGIAKLKHALKIDPKLALAHAWLAKAYSRNGDMEQARQAANQAKELGYKGEMLEVTEENVPQK